MEERELAMNMRYYIVDNNGVNYGDVENRAKAEAMLADIISKMKAEGKSEQEIDELELEIIEGE